MKRQEKGDAYVEEGLDETRESSIATIRDANDG